MHPRIVDRPSHAGLRVLLAGAVVGSMFLFPLRMFPGDIAPVDILLALLTVLGFDHLARRPSVAKRLLAASIPWLWLVLLGSAAALLSVGFTPWAVDTLARDAFSFAVFFAVFHLASLNERVTSTGVLSATISVALLGVAVLAQAEAYRPAGTFSNPNYAGHFLALGGAVVFATERLSVLIRLSVVAIAGFAVLKTGSFGSLTMLLAGAVYFMYLHLRHDRRLHMRLAFALLLAVSCVSTWRAYTVIEQSDAQLGTSITSYRFENTTNVRRELWGAAIRLLPDHPLGVGPYGIKSRALLPREAEVHNDYLAYLVERGVLGFMGLVGFLVALWRSAVRGGAARLVIVMFLAGSLFRETLHFRHAWVFIGLAFAYDASRRRSETLAASRPVGST